jgi:myosin heavy subunit
MQVAKTARDRFSIVHTAKTVEYCITGFRNKNKSEISGDILKSVLGSKNEQYSNIFLGNTCD